MPDVKITSQSALDQFRDAITQKGITPPHAIENDGKLHRFSTNGKPDDDAGWYVFHDGDVPAGSFGDFRSGQSVSYWVADIGRPLSQAETSDFRKKQEEMRVKREADTAKRRAEAKEKAATILRLSEPASDAHPYLVRKGVKSYGLRGWKDLLIIPMYDDTGEVQSLQLISGDGEKKFLSGGKMQGCYFTLGDLKDSDTILIAEGYATAATVHEITGHPVVVAYNAGNLLAVAKSIHAQKPDAAIILCADDDAKTKGNPGVSKATEAALAVGGSVIVPEFGENRPEGATDFNDMAAHSGKAAVTVFFTSRSLGKARATPQDNHDSNQAGQTAFISRPAALKPEPATDTTPTGGRVITGTITDFGTAPYKHDKKNNLSFYLNIKTGDTTRTLWGIDLQKALTESGFDIDDEVAVYDKGKVPVQVMTKIRDAEGNVVGQEPRTVMKGSWQIGSLEEYVKSRLRMAQESVGREQPATDHVAQPEREAATVPDHPAAPRSTPAAEPVSQPKMHFADDDFEAVQKIWKGVPRRTAQHSETGYHILIDHKRKIHITKDRIELARKARHRPDTAYAAACEHARHFWNGQMEIQGDRQHRIKAWAYATAYGVQVTNYTPDDSELIEAEKLLEGLREKMEPAFRPPSVRPHSSKRRNAKLDA